MILAHRVNYMNAEIAATTFASCDGIEFDVRDSHGGLFVTHDAFSMEGQEFREFVTFLNPTKFYIVNIKCEGIEDVVIETLENVGIRQFFLLDCSIPSIIRLGKKGERRIAARFSEFESIQTVLCLKPFITWVWIDTFTCLPLSEQILNFFSSHELKTCLVSPELQKQPEKISEYIHQLQKMGKNLDAVCSKSAFHPIWRSSDLFPCSM